MDMGIVNAGQLVVYEEIPAELRERVEDVILNRRPDATDRLLEVAEKYKGTGGPEKKPIWNGAKSRLMNDWPMRWSTALPSSSKKTPKKPANRLISPFTLSKGR